MANLNPVKRRKCMVMLGGPGQTDVFSRVLTAVIRIGLRDPLGEVPPNQLIRYMARSCNESSCDKNFRNKVSRALHRGVRNGLITMKGNNFKITKQACVTSDSQGKVWMKIPAHLCSPGMKKTLNARNPVATQVKLRKSRGSNESLDDVRNRHSKFPMSLKHNEDEMDKCEQIPSNTISTATSTSNIFSCLRNKMSGSKSDGVKFGPESLKTRPESAKSKMDLTLRKRPKSRPIKIKQVKSKVGVGLVEVKKSSRGRRPKELSKEAK